MNNLLCCRPSPRSLYDGQHAKGGSNINTCIVYLECTRQSWKTGKYEGQHCIREGNVRRSPDGRRWGLSKTVPLLVATDSWHAATHSSRASTVSTTTVHDDLGVAKENEQSDRLR